MLALTPLNVQAVNLHAYVIIWDLRYRFEWSAQMNAVERQL